MPPQTLVLFDIDGTLLLGKGSGRTALDLTLREVFGTSGQISDYQFAGKTDWQILHDLLEAEGFTETQIREAIPVYAEAMARHMAVVVKDIKIHALPGTHELVRLLKNRSDVLIGLMTGNVPKAADVKLRAAGFDPADFKIAVYGSEARIRRDLVPIILGRAEIHCGDPFAPGDVVVIGDTPDDIDCAHSIGARVIAVATGSKSRAELEAHPPVSVLDDLSDPSVVLSLIFGHPR
jgi:phosphoglycolate phosphatase